MTAETTTDAIGESGEMMLVPCFCRSVRTISDPISRSDAARNDRTKEERRIRMNGDSYAGSENSSSGGGKCSRGEKKGMKEGCGVHERTQSLINHSGHLITSSRSQGTSKHQMGLLRTGDKGEAAEMCV